MAWHVRMAEGADAVRKSSELTTTNHLGTLAIRDFLE